MAEHNKLSDRELAAMLGALAPRRSGVDRERLLYLAGHAAALAERRRWRYVSLASMASGWLAAAALLGASWTQSGQPVALRDANPVDAKPQASTDVPAVEQAVLPVEVRDNRELPHGGFSQRIDTTADLRRFSRTGQLAPDHSAGRAMTVGAVELSDGPTAGSPRTYIELRRALSAGGEVL
jgi:hypothetical protein